MPTVHSDSRPRILPELVAFGVFVVAVLLGVGQLAGALGTGERALQALPLLAALGLEVAVVVPAIVFLQRRRGQRLADLGFALPARDWGRALAVGALLGIGIKLATIPVGMVGLALGLTGGLPEVVFDSALDLVMFVAAGTLAALVEEIVFRGYLRDRLATALGDATPGGGMWPTGIATSVLFALGHGYQGVLGLLITMFVGLLLFRVVRAGRFDLTHAIAAHAVFNATSFLCLAAMDR